MQKFLNEEDENKMIDVWERLLAETVKSVREFLEGVEGSPELGKALYDAHAVEVWDMVERRLFVRAYDEIVKGLEVVGTIDGYVAILYAIFGDDAEITITNTPLHLLINIVTKINALYPWITRAGENVISREDDQIVFRAILDDITSRDLANLLKAMTNAGSFVEFTVNID